MEWRIPLSDVRLSEAQRAAAVEVLESGWLSMGPRTEAFESAFAAARGIDPAQAVGVSSCTAGLVLGLRALGVGPGDEVVVPSLTFVAAANAITSLGATPVFADIESVRRPLVDVHDVLSTVTPRTKAVIVVHYGGALFDTGQLDALRAEGIGVIEDAAHATGPVDDTGAWLPCAGDIATFSFFANKNLALGEGGMVTATDPDVAARIRFLRSHGMTTGTWDRHRGHASDYDVIEQGWNFRMTEVTAALGAAGLPDMARHNEARRAAIGRYREALGADIPLAASDEASAAHLAVAVLPRRCRAAVRGALAEHRIQSSFHYPPTHRFTAYEHLGRRPLPHTEEAADRLVTLPLHPWLAPSEIDEIAAIVRCAALGDR